MSILSNPSGAFPTSLIYITVGTLIDVWTIVSLVFYPPASDFGHFLLIGFLITGLALLTIGLLLGPIGRFARRAELPPAEVTPAVAQADQMAAANPPAVVPANNGVAVQATNPMAGEQPPLATPAPAPASATRR